jgi:hypothetical protein
MTPVNPAVLRVGTWNIRWFPRGCSSNQACPDRTTDIPWLSCAMAWMNVDLFTIEEILATPDSPAQKHRTLVGHAGDSTSARPNFAARLRR